MSCGAKMALAPAKNPLTMTPVHRPQNSATTSPVPITIDSRGGRRRPSHADRELPEQAHPAPGEEQQQGDAERHGHDDRPDQGEVGGIPNIARISFCQPTSRQPFHTAPHAPTPMSIHSATVRARPRRPGMPR